MSSTPEGSIYCSHRWNTAYVSIGDQDLSADQALDCNSLLGPAGGQTCNTLL